MKLKLSDLSEKSRATVEKIAKSKGIKPIEVLRHIDVIFSRRKVSKHSMVFAP